uniref:Uncharacterized protein n=1 Tax=Anopheles dirus TaxID=7168 RepID=A0A182NXY1_9DIPT
MAGFDRTTDSYPDSARENTLLAHAKSGSHEVVTAAATAAVEKGDGGGGAGSGGSNASGGSSCSVTEHGGWSLASWSSLSAKPYAQFRMPRRNATRLRWASPPAVKSAYICCTPSKKLGPSSVVPSSPCSRLDGSGRRGSSSLSLSSGGGASGAIFRFRFGRAPRCGLRSLRNSISSVEDSCSGFTFRLQICTLFVLASISMDRKKRAVLYGALCSSTFASVILSAPNGAVGSNVSMMVVPIGFSFRCHWLTLSKRSFASCMLCWMRALDASVCSCSGCLLRDGGSSSAALGSGSSLSVNSPASSEIGSDGSVHGPLPPFRSTVSEMPESHDSVRVGVTGCDLVPVPPFVRCFGLSDRFTCTSDKRFNHAAVALRVAIISCSSKPLKLRSGDDERRCLAGDGASAALMVDASVVAVLFSSSVAEVLPSVRDDDNTPPKEGSSSPIRKYRIGTVVCDACLQDGVVEIGRVVERDAVSVPQILRRHVELEFSFARRQQIGRCGHAQSRATFLLRVVLFGQEIDHITPLEEPLEIVLGHQRTCLAVDVVKMDLIVVPRADRVARLEI